MGSELSREVTLNRGVEGGVRVFYQQAVIVCCSLFEVEGHTLQPVEALERAHILDVGRDELVAAVSDFGRTVGGLPLENLKYRLM